MKFNPEINKFKSADAVTLEWWNWFNLGWRKGLFLSVNVDDFNWRKRITILTQCGKYLWNKLIWTSQHLFSTMFIRVALNENAKQAQIWWKITGICLNPELLQEQRKNNLLQGDLKQTSLRDLMQISPHGPMTWKVMQRNVWKDIVSWRIKRLNRQLHALMTINLKKKNWDPLEICQKYALKIVVKCLYLARSGGTRHSMVCKQTNLHEQSPNGPELVTNALARWISYLHHTSEFKRYWQEKKELSRSRSRRWTWLHVLRQALLQRRARVHPVAQGYWEHPVNKVRIS